MRLFVSILKIMEQRLEQNFFGEALQTHNLRVTWKNVENELRERDGRYGITNRSPDWYLNETFPRVMNSSYILDKENFLSFIDDVLVEVSIVKIVKPYLNELRSRLNSLGFDNQSIEQMSVFREYGQVIVIYIFNKCSLFNIHRMGTKSHPHQFI